MGAVAPRAASRDLARLPPTAIVSKTEFLISTRSTLEVSLFILPSVGIRPSAIGCVSCCPMRSTLERARAAGSPPDLGRGPSAAEGSVSLATMVIATDGMKIAMT
eukprot:Amastigsp_a342492_75.p2 type:complete len:105 gc:universal Amastigsp_a342492_75:1-315(+)